MYNKLKEQEYASMVQKYRSEYEGRNLRGFCLEHKVSYQKMLHCLRRESYRNTQQAEEEAVLEQGLHPLEVELPAKAPVTETQKWKPARKRESCESTPDFCFNEGIPESRFYYWKKRVVQEPKYELQKRWAPPPKSL